MTAEVVGTAVLRDFPLRLWAQSRQHSDEVMREFTLMLDGQRTGQASHDAPKALLELADMFTTRFGPLLDQLYAAREKALAEGRDRMDSEVTLVDGTPELLARVRVLLDAVDEFCRTGDLLTLERPADARRLFDWTEQQLVAQYNGAEPTPWPGPF